MWSRPSKEKQMKIVQIVDDMVHYETPYKNLAETEGRYPTNVLFVEAPDHVFEGWGYLDGEFIKPIPPEGWAYDDATGTFYNQEFGQPQPEPDQIDLLTDAIIELAEILNDIMDAQMELGALIGGDS